MNTTFKLMAKIADKSTQNLEEICYAYQVNQKPSYYAAAFVSLYPFICLHQRRYINTLNQADIVSCATTALEHTLMTYEPDKGSVITLFGKTFTNRMYELWESATYNKRSAEFTKLDDNISCAPTQDSNDLMSSLESLGITEKQLELCRLIIEGEVGISSRDLGKALGCSHVQVFNILKAIRKVVEPHKAILFYNNHSFTV